MSWIGQYILDKRGQPVPCYENLEWAAWFENSGELRRVALDDLGELGRVSTVFLALDYNFSPMHDPLTYRPILWETMVFGGPHAYEMRRYMSREAAERGHAEMVKMIREESHASANHHQGHGEGGAVANGACAAEYLQAGTDDDCSR